MFTLENLIGLAAACGTTVSYVPQLYKIWKGGDTKDISLKMFLILATGVSLWIVYGVFKGDAVIILANTISLLLLAAILFFKLRDTRSTQERARA